MRKFDDILKEISIAPQTKPQYPTDQEIEKADIADIAFWVVHLPIIKVEDPEYKSKRARLDRISERVYEYRQLEGSWAGPGPFEEEIVNDRGQTETD